MLDSIKIIDNEISDIELYYRYVTSLPFYYGERDNRNTPPTGMISELPLNDSGIYSKLKDVYFNHKKDLCDEYVTLDRAYVNCFAPREPAYYHADGNCFTLLYYANPIWVPNEGGETKFLCGNIDVFSVAPVPGRVVIFDGSLQHTAVPFRSVHRFTVALKYKKG